MPNADSAQDDSLPILPATLCRQALGQPAQAWGYSLAKLKELFVETEV